MTYLPTAETSCKFAPADEMASISLSSTVNCQLIKAYTGISSSFSVFARNIVLLIPNGLHVYSIIKIEGATTRWSHVYMCGVINMSPLKTVLCKSFAGSLQMSTNKILSKIIYNPFPIFALLKVLVIEFYKHYFILFGKIGIN